jgi:hypothetical protein
MTSPVLYRLLATYTKFPFGVTATARGEVPTAMVATTELVAVEMTETVLAPAFAT